MPKQTITYNGEVIDERDVNGTPVIVYDGKIIGDVLVDKPRTLQTENKIAKTNIMIGSAILACEGKAITDDIEITLELGVDPVLENNSWETISEIAQKGKAANYWAVGDTKEVLVKGTYGYFSLDINCYAFILGINHNEAYEGKGIHFSFKNSSKKDVAFYTFSMYDSNGTSTNNNWGGSLMRTYCDMFPSFFPADLRAVYSPCTKYTDNTGGFTDSASYVTATVDKTFLLSEFEIFGVRTSANSAEQNFQKQYDYYKAGNSRVRYHHINGTAYNWWTRSCSKISPVEFMVCNSNGSVSSQNATTSIGFVPCFKVG